MIYGISAELLLFIHLTFMKFVALGGFMVLRWRRVLWVHIPSAILGVVMVLGGWLWPFAGVERWLRAQALASGYTLNLVERYVPSWLHPASLSRPLELAAGLAVLGLNIYIYRRVFRVPPPAAGPLARGG